MTRYLLIVLLLAGCQVKEQPPPEPLRIMGTPPDKHGVVCYKFVNNQTNVLSCVQVIKKEY